ncbi:MAG: hypothetical protein IPP47_26720 [Bryobacterales bacterium]|nr:hypothetical protein [Bryobacterales bacterium]
MDIMKMLAELRQEREAIEEAIITLERLARGQGKRRGRPPAWMAALKSKQEDEVKADKPEKVDKPVAKKRGRPPKTAAAQSE